MVFRSGLKDLKQYFYFQNLCEIVYLDDELEEEGMVEESVESCRVGDYRGLAEEWMASRERVEMGAGLVNGV